MRSAMGLAAFMTSAGVMHFVAPRFYDPLIPPSLGPPRPWVYGSGVAEIACAAAVAVPATRRVGAYAMAGLFGVVVVGNVQQALDAWRGDSVPMKAATAVRLPMQVPLVLWALRVAREAQPR